MWANAQRDGRPAEHRWRNLFNAAKFGWRPLLGPRCRAVMLPRVPRRETHSNLEGCHKLVNRSQPLLGQSSPYYEDMWRTYCCLTSFQRLSRLDSVTVRQSSSKRQPNFAALNRGRHLCLAGRPSRWALAHMSSSFFFSSPNLSGRILDVYHTSTQWCCLTVNLEWRSETCCTRLAENTARK